MAIPVNRFSFPTSAFTGQYVFFSFPANNDLSFLNCWIPPEQYVPRQAGLGIIIIMKGPIKIILVDDFIVEPEEFAEDTVYHGKEAPVVSPTSPSSSLSLTSFNGAEVGLNAPTTPVSPDAPGVIPSSWVWTCHICKHRYPLGVTRRCLYDGHVFCSGQIVEKKVGPRKKRIRAGVPCNSEFDYVSWGVHMEWKKKRFPEYNTSVKPGCMQCSYPNQCRYKRMEKEKLPPVIEVVHQSLSRLTDDKIPSTCTPPRKQQTLETVTEEPTDGQSTPPSVTKEKRSKRERNVSSGALSSPGRARTSEVIERVIKNAEKRAAELHAMTTVRVDESRETLDEKAGFVESYIMPVIDFVACKKD